MPTFYVTGRKIPPPTTVSVDAATREEAISQVVQSAAPGEEFEVTSATTEQPEEAPPGGATGATGA
jgi:hypothetical protein